MADSLLITLANNCKQMEDLYIRTDKTNLTAAGWCYLFRAVGYGLDSLGVSCGDLSGEVLDVIADTCPNLSYMSVNHTHISVYQDFVDHWITPNRMPNLKVIEVDGMTWRTW